VRWPDLDTAPASVPAYNPGMRTVTLMTEEPIGTAGDLPGWITEHRGGRGFRAEPVEYDAYPLLTCGPRQIGTRGLAIGETATLVGTLPIGPFTAAALRHAWS
jgi:hypothetical protein